jgi:hypothetical protein
MVSPAAPFKDQGPKNGKHVNALNVHIIVAQMGRGLDTRPVKLK